MFHALILGRIKFGAQGWSRKYNFNDGDLRICGDILHNYLTNYDQVPYADLQYLFGEIMYGGHIVNSWDRIMCAAMLNSLMNDGLLDEIELFPFIDGKNVTFKSPPQNLTYEKYAEYIE